MSKGIFKLLTVSVALAMTGLATAGAREGDVPSVVVKYGDLALDTKAGITKLHARLHAAAEEVCRQIDYRVLGLRDQYDACVDTAVAQSVAAVNNTNLSNFHRFGQKATLVASNRG